MVESDNNRQYLLAIILVGLACLIRPSAAINWLYPAIHLLCLSCKSNRKWIISATSVICATLLSLGILIDSMVYGRPTLTFWNFFRLNFWENISMFYGSESALYYFLQAIPAINFVALPLTVLGIYLARSGARWLAYFVLAVALVNSIPQHKEIRFIYVSAYPLFTYAAYGLACLPKRHKRLVGAMVVLPNLLMMIYFTRHHQSGVIPAVDYLRKEYDHQTHGEMRVFFLMPCHSTPYYGYLHRNVTMDFLSCEPPLRDLEDRKVRQAHGQIPESEFYGVPDIMASFRKHVVPFKATHVVLYENFLLANLPIEWMHEMGYYECARFISSSWSPDERRAGNVVVFCPDHHQTAS